jgi:hypothetical protein
MFDKLFATAINFLKNCLLNACTIVWKNKPFWPNNNCLTRIQTFHRLFEAYWLYNKMAIMNEDLFGFLLNEIINSTPVSFLLVKRLLGLSIFQEGSY